MAATHQDKVMAGLRRYWATQQFSPDLLGQLREMPRAVVRVRAPESFAAVTVTAAMISRAAAAGREWFGWVGDLRSQILAAGSAGLSRNVGIHVSTPDPRELGTLTDCDHLIVDTFRGSLGTDRATQERLLGLIRSARCVYVLTQAGQAIADAEPLRSEFASYPVVECRIDGIAAPVESS